MGSDDELRLLALDKGAEPIVEQQRECFMQAQRGRVIIAVAIFKSPQVGKVPTDDGIVVVKDTGMGIHYAGFVVLSESILQGECQAEVAAAGERCEDYHFRLEGLQFRLLHRDHVATSPANDTISYPG